MQKYSKYFLYGTMFIIGAAVMTIEIAAIRMFLPFFESSFFVLSNILIGIVGALSVGYYFGGRYADKSPYFLSLYMLIAISGVLVLLFLLIATYTLPVFVRIFAIDSGPLVLSVILFSFPAFVLGTVSPFVLRLQIDHTPIVHIGSVIGETFFWGSMGGIVGSFAVGFVTLPVLGATETVLVTGLVLVVLGIAGVLSLGDIRDQDDSRKFSFFLGVVFLSVFLTVLIMMETIEDPSRPLSAEKIQSGIYL